MHGVRRGRAGLPRTAVTGPGVTGRVGPVLPPGAGPRTDARADRGALAAGPSARTHRLPAVLGPGRGERPGRGGGGGRGGPARGRRLGLREVRGEHLRGQRYLGDGAGTRGVAQLDNDAMACREPGHHVQPHGADVPDARLRLAQRRVVDRAALRRDAHALVDDLHDGPVPQPPDGDPDLLVRRRVPGGVVEQLRQDVRHVVHGAGGDADPGLDHPERDAIEPFDLLRRRHDHGGAADIRGAHPGVPVTAQDQQVVGVAFHAHGEVVQGEEGLHTHRVGLVALHRVQFGHHDGGQPGAPARDSDQGLGQLLVRLSLLGGEPDGFVVHGVERLTDLADLVLARRPDRVAGPPRHLFGRRSAQRPGPGQLVHHCGQTGVGDLARGVAQIAQPPEHDPAEPDRHDDDADQGEHHQRYLRDGGPDEAGADVGDLGEDRRVDPLLHRAQQLLPVVGGLPPLLRRDGDLPAGLRPPDRVLQAPGLQGLRPGQGPLQPGPPRAGTEVVQDADRLGVAHPGGVEGAPRGGGEAARRLGACDGDLLLGGVLGGFGQGGGGPDAVRDVGVHPVRLGDAVTVGGEVGDHDAVAEGEGGDGAAAGTHLGAQAGHLLDEAVDPLQGACGAAGDGGEALGPAVEAGDAQVGGVRP